MRTEIPAYPKRDEFTGHRPERTTPQTAGKGKQSKKGNGKAQVKFPKY